MYPYTAEVEMEVEILWMIYLKRTWSLSKVMRKIFISLGELTDVMIHSVISTPYMCAEIIS